MLVLLVAAGIVAVAVALMTIGRAQAQPYILGVLALLAMVGLFNLFAFAAGIIRFTDRTADDPVMGRIADHAYDGLAVTDSARPRGLFQRRLSGADGGCDARRTCVRSSASSSAIPMSRRRCSACSRPRAKASGSRRRSGSPAPTAPMAAGCGCGFVRSAQSKREAKYAVWSIADITRDRERQEDVFKELQHAIEYLDHAPCGFFSVNPSGDDRLRQRDAGELARSRPRRNRLGRPEADRYRVGRRRLAVDLDRGGAGRSQNRSVRHRPAHARRQDHAGAALSQAGVRRRRRARRRRARW